MKKERTLLQKLTPFFFLATGVPIALLALVSQYRLHNSLNKDQNNQIAVDLNHADRHVDMVLDKYNTLLYDFSTDDGVISLVEQINDNQDDMEINSSKIRNELSHICNRNSDILGITIFTADQKVIYYDRLAASSVNSAWAPQVEPIDVGRGTVYQGVIESIDTGEDSVYPFRLARKIIDYRDINKSIGTVVMSIDEKVLKEAMKSGNNPNFLYQDDIVICAPNEIDIGKVKGEVEAGQYRISSIKNQTSGLMISNRLPLMDYKQTLREQGILWILLAIATMGMAVVLSYILTKPYLKEIDTMAKAMSEVEQGNFKVQLPVTSKMSVVIRRISCGFNEMVGHIEMLIEQVKEAILEQHNAELSALEAQIDPHFLYNTLDTINWKAIEKGEFEISEMVGALADILRYTVNNAGDETTLEQELYWLHQYILLLSAKAGKNLRIQMDVPEELKGCKIHKLLLQPFVENAIKHGMRSKQGECRIDLSARYSESQLHILIKDNGNGMSEKVLAQINGNNVTADAEYEKIHLGVMNVRKRLKLYYGEQAELYFESEVGYYTKVHLFIPVILPR